MKVSNQNGRKPMDTIHEIVSVVVVGEGDGGSECEETQGYNS